MADTSVQTPEAGQPQNTSNPEGSKQPQGAGQGVGVQYATVADVQRIFEDLFQRKASSISDRTAYKVQQVMAKLREEGLQVSAEQVQGLIQSQPSQPQAEVKSTQPGPAKGEDTEVPTEAMPPILAAAVGMMQRADLYIEDDDPELKLIDIDHADDQPDVFLAQVKHAMQVKQQRLADTAAARSPSFGGTGGGVGGGKTALVEEMKQLLAHPSQNMARIREVREELRKYT